MKDDESHLVHFYVFYKLLAFPKIRICLLNGKIAGFYSRNSYSCKAVECVCVCSSKLLIFLLRTTIAAVNILIMQSVYKMKQTQMIVCIKFLIPKQNFLHFKLI